jgi:hypothetical protein
MADGTFRHQGVLDDLVFDDSGTWTVSGDGDAVVLAWQVNGNPYSEFLLLVRWKLLHAVQQDEREQFCAQVDAAEPAPPAVARADAPDGIGIPAADYCAGTKRFILR